MAVRGSSLAHYMAIALALTGTTAVTVANDLGIDTESEIDNSYQRYLADRTTKLNSIVIEEEVTHTDFSQTALVDLKLNDSTQLFLGKKNIHYNSLIYLQDYNQGFSSDIKLPSMNSRFKTFTSSTKHANDYQFNTNLGIDDNNNRASGIIWEYKPVTPFSSKAEDLLFTTSYLSGDSDIDNQNGDAVSFTTSASAWNKTLQLHGEYAQSSFKNTKEKSDYDSQRHAAQHYRILYNPFIDNNETKKGKWNIGLEKKTIEDKFQTLFNRGLPSDRDITRLFGHYEKNVSSIGTWTTEASFTREKNNLDKQLDTSDDVNTGNIIGRYKQNPSTEEAKPSIFGQQEYSLHYTQSNKIQRFHLQEHAQNEALASDPNSNHNQYQAVNLEGRYHYPKWQWFYKGGQAQANDKLDHNVGFRSYELEVGTVFSIRDNTINFNMRTLNSRKVHSGLKSAEINYGLSFHRALALDDTSLKLDLHYHQRDTELTSYDSEQYEKIAVSGHLQKRLLKSKGLYPNIDLDLSLNYQQEQNAFSDLDQNSHHALLDVKLSWLSNQHALPEADSSQ